MNHVHQRPNKAHLASCVLAGCCYKPSEIMQMCNVQKRSMWLTKKEIFKLLKLYKMPYLKLTSSSSMVALECEVMSQII